MVATSLRLLATTGAVAEAVERAVGISDSIT
jgi:hypothetical protein